MRTGEPNNRLAAQVTYWVYPRAYGGTDMAVRTLTDRHYEVYPRAYGGTWLVGNLGGGCVPVYPRAYGGTATQPGARGTLLGSIPVRTGEPRPTRPSTIFRLGLSPCVRGNRLIPYILFCCLGLSPCVRGNRWPSEGAVVMERSIPVRTGEPRR